MKFAAFKKFSLMNVFLVSALLLGGCANTGNQVLAKHDKVSISKVIKNGVTTRKQLIGIFGEPTALDYQNNGNTKLVFTYLRSTYKPETFIPVVGLLASGTDDNKKELVVLLDDKDVVQKHSFYETKGETKTGLING